MPTIITRGALSARGYGFAEKVTAANYIEDVFSTYLYTGTRAAGLQITNGIDLSTKGGMVWCKERNNVNDHCIFDTARGINLGLSSNTTAASTTWTGSLTSFNTNGFTLGSYAPPNSLSAQGASWTFRKQAKFFDVVTYTGDGTAGRTVSHNLGSVPGCIIIKSTSYPGTSWYVYHRSLANTEYLILNTTAAKATGATLWNSTTPTSTDFSLGTGAANSNGITYVAYLFAHDAGGFGAAGTDNVISCGSFTTDGSGNATVTLGYEPQYLLVKRSDSTSDWYVWDSMRGLTMDVEASLYANLAAAEDALVNFVNPTATGFVTVSGLANSATYIYMTIRRGPMKTPTSGLTVFSPVASSAAGGTAQTTNFPVDLQWASARAGTTNKGLDFDRLRGVSTNATGSGQRIITNSTGAEASTANGTLFWNNTGFQNPGLLGSISSIYWNFGRAPSFFDVVCYTGTGSAATFSHNLGVAPELMIIKDRASSTNWFVYSGATGATKYLNLNGTAAAATATAAWNDTAPTSSVFTVGTSGSTNGAADTYVAYLFATCPGVSKVGSYTGTGAAQTINCGFTKTPRFIMIKRTDSTGDWYVWDSARGISTGGNDPYLLLNSTAAEVTSTNYVDNASGGFQVTSTAPAAINGSGGTFIFLAISA